MSKNLEELNFVIYKNIDFKRFLIKVLEDFEKRIETLSKKVKKLEQKDSYYPTEEEVRDFKVGGTD